MIVQNEAATCPYLVGDLYYTTREGNPAQTWPGTQWEAIQDCFVRGADVQHPAGSTGGSWTHTQTLAELVSHEHQTRVGWENEVTDGVASSWIQSGANLVVDKNSITGYSGGSQPMDITNPYFSAYIWLRTA